MCILKLKFIKEREMIVSSVGTTRGGHCILGLKLQYFGQLMQRADSFEKSLMLGKIEGGRRRG